MSASSSTCTYKDCDLPHYAKGYCGPHYRRWKRGADMDAPIITRVRAPKTCKLSSCNDPHYAKGFCHAHYERFRAGLPLHSRRPYYPKGAPCRHPGCEEPSVGAGYCKTCYSRYREGRPLDAPRQMVNAGKTCTDCGEADAVSKGLCRPCYKKQWAKERAAAAA